MCKNGYNTFMDKSVIIGRLKRATPSLILLGIVLLLAGLSFLPAIRGGISNTAVSAKAGELDAEAMAALTRCVDYAAENGFTAKLTGKVKARVCGIPYSQSMSGERTVHGDDFTQTAESKSALVKAALKRGCSCGKYTAAQGTYKSGGFVYETPAELDRDRYVAAYGLPFTGIVKYDLDGAITDAERIDENTYRFTLDVAKATEHSRCEVKTLLKSGEYPEYSSAEFTLVTDGTRAVKITSNEKFVVQKFGGTSCDAEYTEVFYYDA